MRGIFPYLLLGIVRRKKCNLLEHGVVEKWRFSICILCIFLPLCSVFLEAKIKKSPTNPQTCKRLSVPAGGFEPPTFGSGDRRSNPLSYAGGCTKLIQFLIYKKVLCIFKKNLISRSIRDFFVAF